jgi:hypothetical protein
MRQQPLFLKYLGAKITPPVRPHVHKVMYVLVGSLQELPHYESLLVAYYDTGYYSDDNREETATTNVELIPPRQEK